MCSKSSLTDNSKSAIMKHIRIDVANAINVAIPKEITNIFAEVWDKVLVPVDRVIWPIKIKELNLPYVHD